MKLNFLKNMEESIIETCNKPHVLIVDDEHFNVLCLTVML